MDPSVEPRHAPGVAGRSAAFDANEHLPAGGRNRLPWLLLVLAAGGWAVAPAWPGASLPAEIVAGGLALAALVAVLPSRQRVSRLGRAALDGAIAASALTFLAWATATVRSGAGAHQADAVRWAVNAVAAVILASLALLVTTRATASRRGASLAVAAGLVALAGGAIAATSPAASTTLGWPVPVLRLAGAALVFLGVWRRPGLDDEKSSRLALAVPAVPVALGLVATVRWIITGTYLQPLVALIGMAVVLLVLGRQFLAIVDTRSTARDLEALVRARTAELATSEVRFRSLVQSSSDVISIVDEDGVILFVTPSAERVFGYQPDDLVGRSIWQRLHVEDLDRARAALVEAKSGPESAVPLPWRLRRSDGTFAECETVVRSLLDEPSVAGIVLTTRDVTERKSLEEQLMREALHDPLTGLANRALLRDRITHGLAKARRTGDALALLLVDLDDFKSVNDGLGHAAGDQVLTGVARRLEQCVRPGDTVARLGGDEFAVLLEEHADDARAEQVAGRVLEVLRMPAMVTGHEVFTPASIGVASLSAGPCRDADELMRNADVAMYMAKGRGKAQLARFEAGMHTTMRERLTLATELRHAVSRNEFSLRYQPIVDLKTSRTVGVEALVRWLHPQRGLTMPDEFIETAESTGVIVPMGRWVLEQACADLARLNEELPPHAPPLYVTVNLSGRQFQEPTIVADLAEIIAESRVTSSSIVLELTETVLMDDIDDGMERLQSLRSLGVRLALDDFGTGYSSLSYLRRMPMDILKVDRSFITALDTAEGPGMVRSILRLGDTFRLATLAEGIETPEQLTMLRALGCTYGQGYLFAAPLARHQIGAMLAAPRETKEPVALRG